MKNRNENNMNSLTHIEDEGPDVKIEEFINMVYVQSENVKHLMRKSE